MGTDVANLAAVIAQIEDTLGRFEAESDRESAAYLRWVAEHPFFAELQREVDRRARQLRGLLAPHLAEHGHGS